MQRVARLGYNRLCIGNRTARSAPRRGQYWVIAASQTSSSPRLILYSKADCHLCHGLKDKISGVLAKAQYMQSPLTDAELEIRDITTNEEWEKEYGMVIPVLKVLTSELMEYSSLPSNGLGLREVLLHRIPSGRNDEIKVKRVPPRSSAEKVSEHILQALGAS